MFRRVLAIILLLLFIIFLPPFFIVESVMKTLIDEQAVVSKIIPASYDVVMPIIAEDSELFIQRMQSALSREAYSDVLTAAVTPLFLIFRDIRRGTEVPNDINLAEVKQAIRKHVPTFMARLPVCQTSEISQEKFRFCRPAQVEGIEKMEQGITNALDKEVPNRLPISPEGREFLHGTLRAFLVGSAYVAWIGLAIAVLFLSLQAWVVSKLGFPAVLKWNGMTIFLLSAVLVVFLIAMGRLPEMLSSENVLSATERRWLVFFMTFPVRALWLWAISLAVIGASLFIGGAVQTQQKKSS